MNYFFLLSGGSNLGKKNTSTSSRVPDMLRVVCCTSSADPLQGAMDRRIQERLSLPGALDTARCLVEAAGSTLFAADPVGETETVDAIGEACTSLRTGVSDALQTWVMTVQARALEDFAASETESFMAAWQVTAPVSEDDFPECVKNFREAILRREDLDLRWIPLADGKFISYPVAML